MEPNDTFMIALTKREERYVFYYDGKSKKRLLLTFRQFAADPELSFTWWDAAMLTVKVVKRLLCWPEPMKQSKPEDLQP